MWRAWWHLPPSSNGPAVVETGLLAVHALLFFVAPFLFLSPLQARSSSS